MAVTFRQGWGEADVPCEKHMGSWDPGSALVLTWDSCITVSLFSTLQV